MYVQVIPVIAWALKPLPPVVQTFCLQAAANREKVGLKGRVKETQTACFKTYEKRHPLPRRTPNQLPQMAAIPWAWLLPEASSC